MDDSRKTCNMKTIIFSFCSGFRKDRQRCRRMIESYGYGTGDSFENSQRMKVDIQIRDMQSDSAFVFAVVQFSYENPVCKAEKDLFSFDSITGFVQRFCNAIEEPSGNALDSAVMVEPPERQQKRCA